MKKYLLLLLLLLAAPAFAAQQEITVVPDDPVIPSIGSLKDAINLRLADIDENFDEIYPILSAGPVYVNTTAPADTKVVWIDTDQDNAIKVHVGGVWTVVGSGGIAGDNLGSAAYSDVVALWTTCTGYLKSDGTCDTPSGSATYPSAVGVANWGGSAWGTSYTVGTAANNLVQLNASAQLPAVSGALLTVTASGFDGNLATTDNTLQEIAQKVDDLVVTGLTSLPTADNQLLQATGSGTYAWTATLEGVGNIIGGTYNNITVTQPATGATLTLVEGSTLATSGAYSITLTSTGATNVTLPTSGTLIGSSDLGSGVGTFLGTPSSANLASAVTDETGSGVAVFGTSPTIATPAITAAEVNGSADDTLTAAEVSSTIVYNTGQSAADVALTLPTAASGYSALFVVGTAQSNKWGVRAGTNDKIYLLAADGTVSAGDDNGYARITAAQVGQSFACWTFKTDSYDWMCKAVSIGTSTFAAN